MYGLIDRSSTNLFLLTAVVVQFSSATRQLVQVSEDIGTIFLVVETVGYLTETFHLPITVTVEGYAGAVDGTQLTKAHSPHSHLPPSCIVTDHIL